MTNAILLLVLAAQTPLGWVPSPESGCPSEETRSCAGPVGPSWAIASANQTLSARPIPYPGRQDALPFSVPFEGVLLSQFPPPPAPPNPNPGRSQAESAESKAPRWDEAAAVQHLARHYVVELRGGWLIAFGAGEFGGSVWWYPSPQQPGVRLFKGNVIDLLSVRSGDEALVFTGLGHLSYNYGKVWSFRPDDPRLRLREVHDFGEQPLAVAQSGGASVLVLTRTRLLEMSLDGNVDALCSPDWGHAYPVSIAARPPDEVWVGMRYFLIRLRPWTESGCEPQWFVPADCATLVREEDKCVCGD